MNNVIMINKNDNVAVVLQNISAETKLQLHNELILISEDILQGHKIAVKNIEEGSEVIKCGYPIGVTTQPVSAGQWVHDHNLKSNFDYSGKYTYNPKFVELEKQKSAVFKGYQRDDGSVGIRNEIWIVPTVGCINSVARKLEREAQKLVGGSIDGVYSFAHQFGCSQRGDDLDRTFKILSGLIKNPNAAGVLVLGLGCENVRIEKLKNYLSPYNDNRIKFLECQSEGDEYDQGLKLIEDICFYAADFKRESISVAKLVVGLKCGASDMHSNITANPLVGQFSDMLTAQGGSVILTEVPEMFGAETTLMERSINRTVFEKVVDMIQQFKKYFTGHSETIYTEPSDSNKAAGVTTLEEKSLGFIQKGGTSRVVDVINYGEHVENAGLNLLHSPGNDLVASTALAAAGSHIILFTTGRGSPFGTPVPTVKISTNTQLYEKKGAWIDFNAGNMYESEDSNDFNEVFFNFIIKLASGEIKAKNEINDFREIALFKDGIIH